MGATHDESGGEIDGRAPFAGRVALVTGASRGLGRELTLDLARAGARIIATASTAEGCAEVISVLAREGRDADALAMDLRSVASIETAVAEAVARHGRIDILINNAGLGTNHDAVDATEEEWDALFAVNVRGLFFACQAVGRHMIGRGYGRIVNMASQAALVGIPRHAAYSASKAAVIGLTRVLALEWAPYGVTVNALAPTWVYTPGTAERLDQPAFLASVVARIPVGRVGTPPEIAAAVRYLASSEAGMVTGTTLVIDGGWTAQ